jgi:hypothetical protein
MPALIDARISLDTIDDQLTWTLARVASVPETTGLVDEVQSFLDELDLQRLTARDVARGVLRAEAAVAHADHGLDQATRAFARALGYHLPEGMDSPRARAYFPKNPSAVTQLALGRQVDELREWPGRILAEPDPALHPHAATLRAALAAGEAALAARRAAETARTQYRLDVHLPFIDRLNAARRSWALRLDEIALALGQPPSWARGFFRGA